jgi:hypothetical protein
MFLFVACSNLLFETNCATCDSTSWFLAETEENLTQSSAMMSGDADGDGNADTAVVQGGTAREGIWQGRP